MTLLQPLQIDCNGDEEILCASDDNDFCGKWNCELVGAPGGEQKVCYGTCNSESERGGERVCSCTDMWGPIQISVPCQWKVVSESQCFSTTVETTITSPASTVATTTVKQSRQNNLFNSFLNRFLATQNLDLDYRSESPKSDSLIFNQDSTNRINEPISFEDSIKNKTPYKVNNIQGNSMSITSSVGECQVLPMLNLWKCSSEGLTKGTNCRLRCNKRTYHRKCICIPQTGNCSWSKSHIPIPCLEATEDTTTIMPTTTVPVDMQQSNVNYRQIQNDFNSINLQQIKQREEELEEEVIEVSRSSVPNVNILFNILQSLTETTSRFQDNMFSAINNIINRLNF